VSPRAAGALAAGLALAADQGSKLWLLHGFDIGARQLPIPLAPWFDLTMAWNFGVSYSWFTARSTFGWATLVAVTAAATIFLAVWMWRQPSKLGAVSLGLIVGGALGNLIDRIAYGAVADFFHFHVGDFSWYVFNIADVAIVAGVAGLLYESFFRKEAKEPGPGAENSPS
jgi:signal peptidase II